MIRRLLTALAAAALLAACYYVPSGGSAGASVKLARSLGSNVGQITLTVTGPGMPTITQTYTADSNGATIQVPSGIGRTFTISADTPSATLSGSVTVDLSPGETKSVVIDPKLAGVKLLVPDPGDDVTYAPNFRIVQIDDSTGAGWTTVDALDFGITDVSNYYLVPYDIDFDDQGRIYVANNYYGGMVAGGFRIDDMTAPASYLVIDDTMNAASIAVDRASGFLYYTSGGSNEINRKSLSDLSAPATIFSIFGEDVVGPEPGVGPIDVDQRTGLVYYVDQYSQAVYAFDPSKPSGSRIVASNATLSYPSDVMVKGDYVYVLENPYDVALSGIGRIVRLDKNLQIVDSYAGPAGDPLVGPSRFVMTLDSRIVFIDELRQLGNVDRLVFMDNMTGNGWTTYGETGTGTGQFNFFGYYGP